MTVKELIELLKKENPDAPVNFRAGHDYNRLQLLSIKPDYENGVLIHVGWG